MNTIKLSKNKLQLFLLVGIVSLFVTTGGILFYNSERNQIRNEKYNELKAIADLKVNQIEQWYVERLSEAQFFSENEPYIEIAKQVVKGNSDQKLLLRKSLSHILTNKRYSNIFIVNKMGELVFSVDTTFTTLDTHSISFTQKAYETKNVTFSDFYYCNTHKAIHLDIVAPIINSSNEVFATLIFRVNPNDYLYPLIQSWPTPSRTAETLLVRKDGDSVQFLNKLRHADHIPLKLRIPLSKIDVPAVQAIMGHIGIFEGVDYRGVEVLSKIRPIKNTPWFMVAKVDSEEIFAELYFRSMLIAIVTFVLILLLGTSVVWFYHYRQRNIYRKLLENEIELHQSQEEFRATLYSIGDGVITTDKKGLVKQLNPVAEALTGWKETDAKGKKLEDVFNIINEETRSAVESPVSKVLKEGLIVGLANHTLLISKNGTEVPIADNGAPIKNRKGQIDGVVLVFRDQTEERAHQNVIKEREEQLKALISQMQLGMAVHEMIFNANNEPIDYRFLDVNATFEKQTGLKKDDIFGKTILEILPNTEPVWIERYGKVLQTGEPITFENYAAELGKYFSVKAYRSQANQFAVLVEDITQRKRDEAELIEREVQFRNLANSSQALIRTSGVDKLCNYFNQTWLKFTGRTFEQEYGNGWAEGVHPDDFDRCLETYVTAFDKHEPFEMEYRLRHVSGEYRIILDLGTPNFNTNGEFIGYIGHCFDITERKKFEEQIRFQADIIDNSPVIAAYHDKELNMVWANRAYLKATGLSLEEIKGKKCYQIWNLSKPCQGCPVITAIETGENASHELTPDNQDHWPDNQGHWLSQASPVRDKEGAVIGAIEFALNITERKLLEESIRESEKQFRQLVDNAPQGIFVQTDGLFAYINPIATKLFGAKNYEELLGTPVIERFHPDYRELVKQRINQLNNERKNVPLIEEVCLKIDGTPFDTEVSAAPINYSGKNGALVFFQDITERKKADNELLALKNELEVKVKEKTKELNERVAELERFHDATIDREIRMKELRDEIKKLKGL